MHWSRTIFESRYVTASSVDDKEILGSDSNNLCVARKIVTSNCRGEGEKYGSRCENTNQAFKDCLGRPNAMVYFKKEYKVYTGKDAKEKMVESEVIGSSLFDGFSKAFEEIEKMKNDFFNSAGFPHLCIKESNKHGVQIEGAPRKESPKRNS